MNTASAIVDEAKSAGVLLLPDGGSLRCRGPRSAVAALLPSLRQHKQAVLEVLGSALTESVVNVDRVIEEAVRDIQGITVSQFRSLLSDHDLADIAEGVRPVESLTHCARLFADDIQAGRLKFLTPTPADPITVCCADCRHFLQDTVGDGSGIGRCAVKGEGSRRPQPLLYPNIQRSCHSFQSQQ